jgi:hypothetical protein
MAVQRVRVIAGIFLVLSGGDTAISVEAVVWN